MSDERIKFIRRHEKEIRPLVSGSFLQEEGVLNQDSILEKFETKVMVYERRGETAPTAQRVLLEASMPANVAIIKPILKALEADGACKGVTLLTDNVASREFENDSTLKLEKTHMGGSVIADIPVGPYGAALVLDTPVNSPTPFILESAKTVFDTKRLYYWSLQLFDPKIADALKNADALLTTDEFTEQFTRCVVGKGIDQIIKVGSPLIDAIDPVRGAESGKEGRRKLNISNSALVLLHSSVVPTTFAAQQESSDLNDFTFRNTLDGVLHSAYKDPLREFVLLTRIHPRMKDTYKFPEIGELPTNMRIIDADTISYDEAVYAADILCCNPLSTEVILAPYRGVQAVVFAYPGEGQFGDILNKMYGVSGVKFLEESDKDKTYLQS